MNSRVPQSLDADLLQLYLSDHLTGATAGRSRVSAMAKRHAQSPIGPPLAALAEELTQERQRLREIIEELGLRPLRHRQAVAWVGEHVGRLKLNGRLLTTSPMTPLLEVELMRSAVIGKLGLWQTLAHLAPELALDPEEFDRLAAQARRQIESLDGVHEQVRQVGLRPDGDI